jgi:hypothetical protein
MLKKIQFWFKPSTAWCLVALVSIVVAVKFYHYNYVQNTPGQAKTLKLPGLVDFLCKGAPHKSGQVDQCGIRSIYGDGDWGVTAYFTIYGVDTFDEAKSIAQYMERVRKESNQERIPISLQVYSVARSTGKTNPIPKEFKIAEFKF